MLTPRYSSAAWASTDSSTDFSTESSSCMQRSSSEVDHKLVSDRLRLREQLGDAPIKQTYKHRHHFAYLQEVLRRY